MSTNVKKKTGYHFHPLEVSLIGYSGAGKTTLLTKLIERLRERWKIAFVKHDAHRFEMDKEGKDTFRAKAAGAEAVYIADADAHAFIGSGEDSLFTRKSRFLDYDAVLIEGHKALPVDKLCFVDDQASILKELPEDSLLGIKAFIGTSETPPSLPIDRPYFCRDSIAEIAELIESLWLEKIRARPLKALILAGGRSERMGQDKGLLQYAEKPQAFLLYELLEGLGLKPYLSLREDQWSTEDLFAYRLLHDRFLGFGPLSGILTAMHEDTESAWLVLACDLPLLNEETLRHLLAERNPRRMATAYRSTHDGLPEPLCAIYEPKIRLRLLEALGLGLSCPRKVLLNSDSHIMEALDPLALENANTPEDYSRYAKILEERSLHASHD